MSFGAADVLGAPCPCGTGRTYAECCAAFVVDGVPAPTAEQLMRSRYTAYVLGATDHLVRTWHPRTRPADVEPDPELRWTGLEVRDVEAGGVADATGVVAFTAGWTAHGQSGQLRERSRFERRGGRWVYVEGDQE